MSGSGARIFRHLNRALLLGWRMGAGSFFNRPWPFGQVMVVTHRGRSSGLHYQTPVNFARHGGAIYAVAGFGESTDWYRNLRAESATELWIPSARVAGPVAWWKACARVVTDPGEHRDRLRDILAASGPAGYLNGYRANLADDKVELWAARCPVIRFDLVEPRTGDGGPGDLANWCQITVGVLALIGLGRRWRRSRPRSAVLS